VNASGDGALGSVVVSGPNGYTSTITATKTLTALVPGVYTVVADSSTAPDSVVGTVIDTGVVTGSPATVTAHVTAAVTAQYAAKGRVGGLWIANNDRGTIPEFSSNQLRATGTPVLAESLATQVGTSAGLAIDASGNLWESAWNSDTVLMYSPAARNAGGSPTPTTVLVSSALSHDENIAFDPNGNLWITSCGNGGIVEFTPSQLAAGGTQTPAVTISRASSCPWGLTFDGAGDVWVADFDLSDLVEYSAAQLATTGSPTPVDTIGANGGSLAKPSGVAFDASGNLWVSNFNATTVVGYSPSQLTAGGAPVPATTITMPASSRGLGTAFDNRGTLWVTDESHGVVYGLTSAQLAAGGTPSPVLTVTVGLASFVPEQLVFDQVATAVGVAAASTRLRTLSVPQLHQQNRNVETRHSH
jgi:sugar lactone lactonase YvrE